MRYLPFLISVAVFLMIQGTVGNPHVGETFLALTFAVGAGIFTWAKIRSLNS